MHYIHIHTYNRVLYTYINTCTYMHPHRRLLHPLCSWSGYCPIVFNITPQLLYPEERRPVSLQYEAGWTLGPVWTIWRRALPGFEPRIVQPRSLITVRTTHTSNPTSVCRSVDRKFTLDIHVNMIRGSVRALHTCMIRMRHATHRPPATDHWAARSSC